MGSFWGTFVQPVQDSRPPIKEPSRLAQTQRIPNESASPLNHTETSWNMSHVSLRWPQKLQGTLRTSRRRRNKTKTQQQETKHTTKKQAHIKTYNTNERTNNNNTHANNQNQNQKHKQEQSQNQQQKKALCRRAQEDARPPCGLWGASGGLPGLILGPVLDPFWYPF